MTVARRSWSLALAAAAGALPSAVHAQGFGLNEIGSCAVARGFAVTAQPCADASTLFWNPAAAVRLDGTQVLAGAAAVKIGGDFTQDLTARRFLPNVPIEVPPHLFATYRINPTWAAGLGVYVPYGLTSQWRPDFPGRFLALKASLATVYVQPTIAWDVIPNRLAIGGGPIFGHSTVELYQALDLAPQVVTSGGVAATNPVTGQPLRFQDIGVPVGTEFGRARLTGSANAFGFQVGGQLKVTPELQLGVRWLSALYFEYDDAEAKFEQTPTRIVVGPGLLPGATTPTPLDPLLAAQFRTTSTPPGALTPRTGSSAIKHPGQVQAGINYSGLARTNLSVDYTFFTWSDFDVLPVAFGGTTPRPPSRTILEDYDDSWRISGGIDHTLRTQLLGGLVNDWAVRAGFGFAKSPAPDETVTPLLPEQDRRNYTLGVGIPLTPRFGLDFGYLRVDTDGRRGRIVERTSPSQTAEELNSGFYRLKADIYSLSLKARF